MAQNLLEQQNLQKIQAQQAAMAQNQATNQQKVENDAEVDEVIDDIASEYIGLDDIEAIEKLKSWIEVG